MKEKCRNLIRQKTEQHDFVFVCAIVTPPPFYSKNFVKKAAGDKECLSLCLSALLYISFPLSSL